MSLYDDPDLEPAESNNITFVEVGDRVRGTIIKMESIDTQYGKVAKYWLFDLDNRCDRTMLAGATDLWSQLYKLRPAVGDVLNIELTAIKGRFKVFSVDVESTDEEPF